MSGKEKYSPMTAIAFHTKKKIKAMQCGMIGLGRMGANMARRLLRGGHEVVVSNRSPGPIEELEAEGAVGARSLGG